MFYIVEHSRRKTCFHKYTALVRSRAADKVVSAGASVGDSTGEPARGVDDNTVGPRAPFIELV